MRSITLLYFGIFNDVIKFNILTLKKKVLEIIRIVFHHLTRIVSCINNLVNVTIIM